MTSVGDVNGDGYDDLASIGNQFIQIYFGLPGGNGAEVDMTSLDDSEGIRIEATGGGSFYDVGAAGDVNGDGLMDIIATTNDNSDNTIVVYGQAEFGEVIQVGTTGNDVLTTSLSREKLYGGAGDDRGNWLQGSNPCPSAIFRLHVAATNHSDLTIALCTLLRQTIQT